MVQILSPRLKIQRLVAIERGELFLFDGQWFAMRAPTEIAFQFDEQNRVIPFDIHRNLTFAKQLPSSNPVATVAVSIDADKGDLLGRGFTLRRSAISGGM